MAEFDSEIVSDESQANRRYVVLANGEKWSCRINLQTRERVSEWQKVEVMSPIQDEPRKLYLILQEQHEGEPKHWSIHAPQVNAMGEARGPVWQVMGDAESMTYTQSKNVNLFKSGSFRAHEILNTDLSDIQVSKINEIANHETPPSAPNRREVKENCQGWTMRVLWRLVDEGIVSRDIVQKVETWKEPI